MPEPEHICIETDHSRVTMVNLGNREVAEKIRAELEQDGSIKVFVTDPRAKEPVQFNLYGFTIIQDAAGVEVLYYKFKPEKQEAVYYLTDHPDAPALLSMLRETYPQYRYVDMEDTLKDMVDVMITKTQPKNQRRGIT